MDATIHDWRTLARVLVVLIGLCAALACRRRLRRVTPRRRRLAIGGGALVLGGAVLGSLGMHASASGTITLVPVATGASDFVLSQATYTSAKSTIGGAVSGSGSLSIPVSIPDLQALSVSNLSFTSDDTHSAIAVSGSVTIKGVTTDAQLTAVWPNATSAAPVITLAVKPSDTALSSLNSLWANASLNPTITHAVVIASPSSGAILDPSVLPSSAQGFYAPLSGTLGVGRGMSLIASIDASTDQAFSNALAYLGEGTSITLQGTLSASIAPLFGTASDAQQSGLDLRISDDATGSALPSWITARTSTIELQLTSSGGTILPAVQLTDTMTTSWNGKVNTFSGSASYSRDAFGVSSVGLTYGLAAGTTLQTPFSLDGLTLSNPGLALSLTTGGGTHSFAGTFTTDASIGSHTVHLTAGITAGSGGAVGASLGATGSIGTPDAVALANALLGTGIDASSLGDPVTLTGVGFSFSKDPSSQTFALTASATIRSLAADVLVSLRHATGAQPTLLVGLHVTDAKSTCKCITVGKLLGGSLSSLVGDLTLPGVDVMGTIGFGGGATPVTVSTADLSVAETGFLSKVYSTLPSLITFSPKLSFAGNLAIPDSVASTFGMPAGSSVLLTGDVGIDLGAFSGSTAPALSGDLNAALPPMTASLPSWVSTTGTWTLHLAVDSSKTVTLGIDGSLDATVAGTLYNLTATASVSKSPGGTAVSLGATINHTFTNLFGISWLTASNPSVALTLDTRGGAHQFTGSLSTVVTVAGHAAQVAATISKADGTDASIEVTTLDAIPLSDVAAFFGADLSGVSGLPSVSIDHLDVKLAAGSSGLAFDLRAATTMTTQSGSSISASLMLSLQHKAGANQVLVGFEPTTSISLSSFVSTLPSGLDFTFPQLAVVLAHPAVTLDYATLDADQQAFFKPFCGDAASACASKLDLNDGLSIVAAVTLPTSIAQLVDHVGVATAAPILVTGTLPIFGGDLSKFSLTVDLPPIAASSSTPDFFQQGSLSLALTPTSMSLTGSVTLNIPKGPSVTTALACTGEGGIWRTPNGGGSTACYDQVPFDLSAQLAVTPVVSMTLTGGLHQGAQWQAPLGVSWLSLNDATLQFGVQLPGPTITLGFDIGASIAGHDFFGAILASVTVTEAPPFLVPNLEGFRIDSQNGLSMQDLVSLASTTTGKSFTLGSAPNVGIRKVDLSFSEVNDPQLCLTQGIHVAGDLYINPPAGTGNIAVGGGCPTSTSSESSRAVDCQNDSANGCFAAVDVTIDDKGLHAGGSLGSFSIGPISFGGALVDLEVDSSVQRLLVKGSMSIAGFANGTVDLLVSDTNLHFRGHAQVLGSAFDAYLDGDASYKLDSLASLKQGASFQVSAVLKADFLNQAAVAISGPLQQLRPAIAAIDVILGDLSNADILGAIVDLPTQIANLGVSLPEPLGSALSTISSKLATIKSDIHSFGHTFDYGVDQLLNGFTLSFPGLPGTIQPPSATCLGTWSGGNCYGIPPGCFIGICSSGTPGVVVYPTCITTTVDGVCYSVPPITGVHVPGLCEDLHSVIPAIPSSCSASSLSDTLIMPALREAFRQVTGYDIGTLSLSQVFDGITNALGSGKTIAIDCAQFSAGLTIGSTPSANVSLAADLDLFGSHHNFGIGWNLTPGATGNVGTAILNVIDSIIHPTTGVSCGLPADWNSNAAYPDVNGTAPTNNGGSGPPPPPPPPTMSLSLDNAAIAEGDTTTARGSITPAPSSAQTVSLSWGDGSSGSTTTGTDGSFSASHAYRNAAPGHDTGQFVVSASAGTSGPSATSMLTISNTLPSNLSLTTSAPSVDEGSAFTLSGSFADPGPLDTHTVLITWGDGRVDTLALPAAVTSFSQAHTYADNNGTLPGYPIGVVVTDDDHAAISASTTINVNNVAPHAIAITPAASSTPEKQLVQFGVSLVDPGLDDSETVVVDWGDGSPTETLSIGTNRSFSMSHQWTEADTAAHPDGNFPVSVRVTDKDGGVGAASIVENVTNVAPSSATAVLTQSTINEGDSVTVHGNFADVSDLDSHTVTVDWGQGWGANRYQVIQLLPGIYSYEATRQFGDDGAYAVAVSVADDDGATATASAPLTVLNIAPTAAISRGTATSVRGTPTFFGHAGAPVGVSETTTDPGSDDETITWSWGDGSQTSTTYLASPPNPDPLLSPQVGPRAIADAQQHAWQRPCVYTAGLRASDDDGGAATDANQVVITGNNHYRWDGELWQGLYQLSTRRIDPRVWARLPNIDPTTLSCYLQITRSMSTVLGTVRPLTTSADALNVLHPRGEGDDPRQGLDSALLTAWLDFANGAFDWNTPIRLDDESPVTTPFHVIMANAERVRLDPTSTKRQLRTQLEILSQLVDD